MSDVVDEGTVVRSSHGVYRDPLDVIWVGCLRRLGITLQRSSEVYASWDGRSVLTLSTEEHFDEDDSLAQLILHELCHALVQGPAMRRREDWGLDNTQPDASAVEEHACHRLQAALLDLYGLRSLLAVTTSWRTYWDALPADPLAHGADPAIERAVLAWPDAVRGPWSGALHDALRATADLADLVRAWTPPTSLWHHTLPRTPAGLAALGRESCGSCTWNRDGACLALDEPAPAVEDAWPACVRWEARLDASSCAACGACCREGFHLVDVDPDDALARTRPELLVYSAAGLHLPRPDGRCVLLAKGPPHLCTAYADRPTACREFAVAGEACLIARRRVGLSRR